jgi:hypothetical protein
MLRVAPNQCISGSRIKRSRFEVSPEGSESAAAAAESKQAESIYNPVTGHRVGFVLDSCSSPNTTADTNSRATAIHTFMGISGDVPF